ncbi:adenosylmethionine-8-amino-7-oxononanoate aminotransferase [Nocardioides aromaticivorans]|uniref:Adenosylmethionine-8-amino-7-oxononanoate aminotransferase n=1 Tax=Nocardioides aromaticivorans TaxID=200618 RepID=A0A7Y9ZGH3_9ACTN|nr:aminotransferase class III-fold pyridoxal phosphate-dependent enzyme [Nocardioides aromaticivorans]NYI45004.1 adenosylmethionine-8-amino-7-oxononanoate aminotransferase [Nocardioides aromaticivorans]
MSALLKQHVDRAYPTISHGQGVFLYDTEGRRYLDGAGGAMTASIGHGVLEIADALNRQLSRVAFTYRTQFTNEPAEELARRLAALAPGDLNHAFFVSSGSEATEFAIRAAVGHWRERGKPEKVKILSRDISYHGMTMGALSMSGHAARRPDYGTLLHPFPVVPAVHAFRHARPGESDEQYAERAAAEFEAAVITAGPETVAGIIVEPIVGAAGGVLVPPTGYLQRLRQFCDRLGVLLILDEVITGMGRTGDWFASITEGVVPDLLATGKGLSAGYSPMGAVLMRDHMVEVIRAGSGVAPFGHTFSGNPLGAAACLAVLDHLEQNEVLANVRQRGKQLAAGLLQLAVRFPFVADVRGRGLLWGFEFLADPLAKAAPDPVHQVSGLFVDACFERGLIVYPAGIAPLNNAVILSPPLTISEDEVDLMLEILEGALEEISGQDFLKPAVAGGQDNPTRQDVIA